MTHVMLLRQHNDNMVRSTDNTTTTRAMLLRQHDNNTVHWTEQSISQTTRQQHGPLDITAGSTQRYFRRHSPPAAVRRLTNVTSLSCVLCLVMTFSSSLTAAARFSLASNWSSSNAFVSTIIELSSRSS